MDVTARNLIEQAFRIPWTSGLNERVLGGPIWIDNDHYDVEARIDESMAATFATMSNEQRKEQTSLMMQALLADRFKLKVHFETRQITHLPHWLSAKGEARKLAAANEVCHLLRGKGDNRQRAGAVASLSAENLRRGVIVPSTRGKRLR